MYKIYKIDAKEKETVLIQLKPKNSWRRITYAVVSEKLHNTANEILYKRGLYFLDYLNFISDDKSTKFVLLTQDETVQELISSLLDKDTSYLRCSHYVFAGTSWIPSIKQFALEFPELHEILLDRIKPESDFSVDIEDTTIEDWYEPDYGYHRPQTKLEYYGYEPDYELPIDQAERLYGIPDPRLVEDD